MRAFASCMGLVAAVSLAAAQTPNTVAGALEVKFLFDAPSTVEPTYHRAIWLPDEGRSE